MTSSDDNSSSGRRSYDAEASRRALLEAGRALFEELGYDRATTREIGERAGVDPALIARYFDGKEGLFLAAIAEAPTGEDGAPETLDVEPRALAALLLERWEEDGHSPVSRALASPALSDDVRRQVRAALTARVLTPLTAELAARDGGDEGAPGARLRAELLVALALGVAVTRANGTLEALAAAPRERVLDALAPLLDALADG